MKKYYLARAQEPCGVSQSVCLSVCLSESRSCSKAWCNCPGCTPMPAAQTKRYCEVLVCPWRCARACHEEQTKSLIKKQRRLNHRRRSLKKANHPNLTTKAAKESSLAPAPLTLFSCSVPEQCRRTHQSRGLGRCIDLRREES